MSNSPSRLVDPEGGWDHLVPIVVKLSLLIVGVYVLIVVSAEAFVRFLPDTAERKLGSTLTLDSGGRSEATSAKERKAQALFNNLLRTKKDRRNLDYRLVFLDQKEPNAFAAPGGTVMVSTGLLEMMETKVGLAFVLAHELGHHQHRHSLRSFSRQVLLSLVFGLFDGNGYAVDLASLAELRNSRSQETEADMFALGLVRKTLQSTQGITEFFKKIQKRYGGKNLSPSMLSTHPEPEERAEALRAMNAH